MASRHEMRIQNHAKPMLDREFSVSVCLSRGPLTSESFTARRRDIDHVGFNSAGTEIETTTREYMIAVADSVLDGDEVEPLPGDIITEGEQVYQVLPDNEQRSVVLMSGGYEFKVLTKRIN